MSKKINKENVSTPLPHREGSGVSLLLNAWKIRREERLLALMAFVMMTALNALMICRYFEQFIVAAILVFCAFYSFLFLYRIIHEVIGAKRWDAALLSTFFFSFAYVMVAVFVPDHFIMSTMMLLLTLYVCGIKQKNKQRITRSARTTRNR